MSDHPALDALLQRLSTPSRQLGGPAPSAAERELMLQAAVRVPDHGKLVPFRLLTIEGDDRLAVGSFLARRSAQRNPGAEAMIEKDRQRLAHAPLVVTVIARPRPHPKVPEWEQLLTAGCVCMNLLHAAHALGYGAQWLTAWMAGDRAVADYLGLAADERIVGFIHIGTARIDVPERERPALDTVVERWTAPSP